MISIPKKKGRFPATPRGVVGMNFRNRHLVDALNPRSLISIANDKVATKSRLEQNSISTAKELAVISYAHELEEVYQMLLRRGLPFVLKPARSSRGRGVILFQNIDEDGMTQSNGYRMVREEFNFFIQQTLQGEYSFGRPQDGVLFEEMIETDRSWIMDDLPGAPDLRIVLIEGQPELAMARLPTTVGDGRANLHCGAVGVGIDLASHLTRGGVQFDEIVDRHPDTDQVLAGREVEDFGRCLKIAVQCFEAVPLGLVGVDLMRDVNKGPVVIEINARPGLAIQIANRKGLLANDQTSVNLNRYSK